MAGADTNFAISEALNLLQKYGYANTIPVPISTILQLQGILVFQTQMPDKFSEISGYIDMSGGFPKIMINADEHYTRQAFTMAHELGHWILHRSHLEENPELGILYRRGMKGERDPKEIEANAFAANLLVPAHLLRKYGFGSDERLANLFGVSLEVIRFRRQAEGL